MNSVIDVVHVDAAGGMQRLKGMLNPKERSYRPCNGPTAFRRRGNALSSFELEYSAYALRSR